MDVTNTTAIAADVSYDKYFYGADGVRTAGTAEGYPDGDNIGYGYAIVGSAMVGTAIIGSGGAIVGTAIVGTATL